MSSCNTNMNLRLDAEATLKGGMLHVKAFIHIGQVDLLCCSYKFITDLVASKSPTIQIENLCQDMIISFEERLEADYQYAKTQAMEALNKKLHEMFGIEVP